MMKWSNMNRPIFLLLIAVLAMGTALAALPASAPAQPDAPSSYDFQRVPWKQVRYRASNWATTLTAAMTLEALPAGQTQAALLKSDRGTPIQASGPQTLYMRLDMRMDFLFRAPVQITNEVWFNPDDAAALGRYRLRRGEDDFEKTYRFTQQGVFRRNREPGTAEEAKLNPEDWSRMVETFYPHDLAQLGCPVVTDRLLLIYIVSAANRLKDGQPLSLCVFGKRQLHRVWLKAEGRQLLKADFIERKQQIQTQRQGEIEARKISLRTEPMAPGQDEAENFSFLGLIDNIVIFVDPHSNLPLQVSGDIPEVGSGDLKLLEVELK
jgi:hypothetical protein